MLKDLEDFIRENQEDIFVTGGISEKEIEELEKELKLVFRSEIRNYLLQYGIIMGYGVEMLGCGKNSVSSLVKETKRYREYGLSDEFIVIRNADEWIYCINNNNGEVSSWDRIEKKHLKKNSNFDAYILSEMVDAKEDWD